MGKTRNTGRNGGVTSKGETDFPYRVDFLIAIISLLFPFGWSVSGFPPNIILACACWTITLCAVLHFFWKWSRSTGRLPRLKWIIIFGLPIAIFAFARKPVAHQYHMQHSPPPTDTNYLAINSLTGAIISNKSDLSLPVLISQENRLLQEKIGIEKKHEIQGDGKVTLNDLRDERQNALALQDIQKKKDEIQREKDEIKKNQEDKEASRKAIEKQRLMSSKVMPIFNEVIRRFVKILSDIGNDVGLKPSSDFPGATPEIYQSALEKNGFITNGTNIIAIGTNAAWNFEISTILLAAPYRNRGRYWPQPFQFASLNILNTTTNKITVKEGIIPCSAVLTITPHYLLRDDGPFAIKQFETNKIAEDFWFNEVTIKLDVTNGLAMEETVSLQDDYMKIVDKALRGLIETQDQQAPLKAR